MNYKLTIVFLLMMVLMCGTSSAATWRWHTNSSEVVGIGDVGYDAHPVVYNYSGQWNLIIGGLSDTSDINGFTWNGTQWVSNLSIIVGLPNGEFYTWMVAPTVFQKDSVWYLVFGEMYGDFYGYEWNGIQWISNSTIKTGLSMSGSGTSSSHPFVFQNWDGIWTCVVNEEDSNPYANAIVSGFTWNGTQWISNGTVVSGLTGINDDRMQSTVYQDGVWKLILGGGNNFYGYSWSGSAWVVNSSVIDGLVKPSDTADSAPNVFYRDSAWRLIFGDSYGISWGRTWILNGVPTVPNISSPVNGSTQSVRDFNITWNTSTDADVDDTMITYHYQVASDSSFTTILEQGNQSATFKTQNRYDGVYYIRVRSYDTYDYSDWSSMVWLNISGAAKVRYVNTTGWWVGGNTTFYSTSIPITAAVGNSSAYDKVYVYNGSYTGVSTIAISNFILEGEGSNLVNLSGGTPITINSGANYVNVSGFNITFTGDFGIDSYGNYANISYNKFRQSGGYIGLFIHGNHGIFINNTISGLDYGIAIDYDTDGTYNVFTNNIITGSVDAFSLYGAGTHYSSHSSFTGGSIDSSSEYDYYCQDGSGIVVDFEGLSGLNNNGIYFKDTNFTSGTKKIYLYTGGILNLTNNGITMRSARSVAGAGSDDFSRTIYNLSSTNVTFKDSGVNYRGYRLQGLSSSSSFTYYKNDVKQSVLTTNGDGDLSYFSNSNVADVVFKIVKKEASVSNISSTPSGVRAGGTLYIVSDVTINDGAGVSSVIVRMKYPNGSYLNNTMALVSGSQWIKGVDVQSSGIYTSSNFYITDADGVSYDVSNTMEFVVMPFGGGGGDEGTTPVPTTTVIPTPTPEVTPVSTNISTGGGGGGSEYGSYYIVTKPSHAQIYIDDTYVGKAPLTIKRKGGEYGLTAVSGAYTYIGTIKFRAGEMNYIFIDLIKGTSSVDEMPVGENFQIVMPKNGKIFSYMLYFDKESVLTYDMVVNKPLKSCDVGIVGGGCSVSRNDTIGEITFKYDNQSNLYERVDGKVSFTDVDGYVSYVDVTILVINVMYASDFKTEFYTDGMGEPFFRVSGDVVSGVRWWWLGSMITGVASIVVFKRDE